MKLDNAVTSNRNIASELTLEQLEATYNKFAKPMKGQVAYLKVSEKTYLELDRWRKQQQGALAEEQDNPILMLLKDLPVRISNFVIDSMAVGFDLDGNVVQIFSFQENNG